MSETPSKCLDHYTYTEVHTANGSLFTIHCHPDDVEEVKAFFAGHVRDIEMPVDHKVNVSHGSYGQYSRYEIVQHRYAGGEGCYMEVLEIKNPPEGRWGIILHQYNCDYDGSCFSEWETLKDASRAFDIGWTIDNESEEENGFGLSKRKKSRKQKGFKRFVECGVLEPWFYAIGTEELIGDYCFPYGLQDDPVFRFGRKFVVTEGSVSEIKTCLGTRLFKKERHDLWGRPNGKTNERWVYWDDGSIWKDDRGTSPRPVEEKELWIAEAVAKFKELLSGQRTEFKIEFIDGSQFSGKWAPAGKRVPSAEGRYTVRVTMNDGQTKEGYIDFTPNQTFPDLFACIRGRFKDPSKIEKIEILKTETKIKGKKWKGVFFQFIIQPTSSPS